MQAFQESRLLKGQPASDLYSFGATLKWLHAFSASGAVHDACMVVLQKCMSRDPSQRPSARSARHELERAGLGGSLIWLRQLSSRLRFLVFLVCLGKVFVTCSGGFSDVWSVVRSSPFLTYLGVHISLGVLWFSSYGIHFADAAEDAWLPCFLNLGLMYWFTQVMQPEACPVRR